MKVWRIENAVREGSATGPITGRTKEERGRGGFEEEFVAELSES